MTSFSSSSLHWLRRLLHGPGKPPPFAQGSTFVMDGQSAVAAAEMQFSEGAGLGATFPAAAGARLWSRAGVRHDGNRVGAVNANDPRGALAGALGLSMSGQRATAFLAGPDIFAGLDLLAIAAGQHLPLVVHLACRATAGHAQALGSGHRSYHAASDTGCFQLFATSVQEAVDFALVARRVSERTLVPGLVAMDVEQTAAAAQEVCLPALELIESFLGPPSQMISAPTEAQRLIFGDTRRLVPRSFDIDRPAMLSSLQGPESYGLGAAGQRVYFHDHVPACLHEALETFASLTGRRYAVVQASDPARADIALVAQGAAFETIDAFAEHLRREKGATVRSIGLRSVRPLPVERLVEALAGTKLVAVLERDATPLAGDGPLLRELRAACDRARPAPDRPRQAASPRFVGVSYGVGGLPLRTSDLQALMQTLIAPEHPTYYLGLDFVRSVSIFPKQRALMDSLRRTYPRLEQIGVRGSEPPLDLRPDDALTIVIHRTAGPAGAALAGDAVAMIHHAFGGSVRTRPGVTWQRFGEPGADLITHARGTVRDPGDDVPVDIAVIATDRIDDHMHVLDRLSQGGAVLCADQAVADEVQAWPPGAADDGRCDVFVAETSEDTAASPWHSTEALLGGLLALIAARRDEKLTAAKARQARLAVLRELPAQEQAARLEAFVHGFESLTRIDPGAGDAPTTRHRMLPDSPSPRPPREARIDALSRSWDHIGVFYRTGRTADLSASPHVGSASLPSRSSTLRSVAGAHAILPVFDPSTCDGHPCLWTTCPDGSLLPLVISARVLIDRGIEMAGERGQPADALRAIAAQLAKRINKIVATGETDAPAFGALLRAAFNSVLEKMNADESRRASMTDALTAVDAVVGALPVARTPVFFDEPERQSPGSGELFTLIPDPDTCKSPELLVAACEGHGLQAVEQTPEAIRDARRLCVLWRELPDTPGATIERARTHPDIGPLAAIMLSRHCLHAMTGGDGAEPGSGPKLALRTVLGLAEFHLQPRQQKLLGEIDALRSRLDERIHATLATALPTKDLDALAEGLGQIESEEFDLGELSKKVDTAVTSGRVDAGELARLVEAARSLADLRWRIAEGPTQRGRSRAGVVVAPGTVASWAGVFPYNPFQNPVVIDATGAAGPLALGLLEGQLRQVIDGFRIMRRAKYELDGSRSGGAAASKPPDRFRELTDDERALCPPILIVGDGRALGGAGLADVAWLLDSDLPVKIVVLSGAGGRIDGGLGVDALDSYPAVERIDPALLALLGRKAFVLQSSFAYPDHLAQGVLNALACSGPAFLHLHAPSPERHGFDVRRLLAQARLAVDSRAFPLIRFDPRAEGVFGSRLDLSANPAVASAWETRDNAALTPADWAATEQRFAHHFQRAEASSGGLTPVAEYLDLPPDQRAGRSPAVVDPADAQRRLRVSDAVIADVTERSHIWRTLQELAGIVTPFTRKVRADLEEEYSKSHDAEVEALKRQHEQRIARLRADFEAEAAARVTEGLLSLAGYGGDQPSAAERNP